MDRVYWKCSTSNCPATIYAHINLPTKVAGGMRVRRENTEIDHRLKELKQRLNSQEISPVQFAYTASYIFCILRNEYSSIIYVVLNVKIKL